MSISSEWRLRYAEESTARHPLTKSFGIGVSKSVEAASKAKMAFETNRVKRRVRCLQLIYEYYGEINFASSYLPGETTSDRGSLPLLYRGPFPSLGPCP